MRRIALSLTLGLALLGGVLLMPERDAGGPARAPAVAVDPHGAEIEQARTLVVGRAQPPVSRPGVVLNAMLVGGRMPHAPTSGVVLTDEDCAADFRGVSNCLNRIRLEDGREIAVRHPHRMSDVPCFAPGEPVQVVPA